MANETKPTKMKFKRKLTSFLCQEMLYDYALGRLDADRKAAIEEFLQEDKECQTILESIRKGLAYAERLGGATLEPSVVRHLRDSENAVSLGRKYSSWREWPEAVRWSLTAIIISTCVAMVVAVIPWSRLPSLRSKKSDTVEIAQLGKIGDKALDETQDHQEGDIATEEGSGDEEIEAPDAASSAVAAAAGPGKKIAAKPPLDEGDHDEDEAEAPSAPTKQVAGLAPNKTSPQVPAAPASPASQAATAVTAKPAAKSTAPSDEAEPESGNHREAKAKGFVFRAFMTLANLDELGPKITENITELGGDKAGEVELGWKRGTGRYYHFALPEENEEKLLEKLRVYGPVRISKDPHPRVMPTGQIRVILWVESAK